MIAGNAAQAVFAEAIDDSADAGPVDRAGAHRAGLGGGIERGPRQHLAAERAAGLRRGETLGMRGAVVIGHVAVLGFDQDLAFGIDDDATEGMVAVGEGTAGDRKGKAQEVLVALGPAAHRSSLVNAPPYAGRQRSARLRWSVLHTRIRRGTSPPGDRRAQAVRRDPR